MELSVCLSQLMSVCSFTNTLQHDDSELAVSDGISVGNLARCCQQRRRWQSWFHFQACHLVKLKQKCNPVLKKPGKFLETFFTKAFEETHQGHPSNKRPPRCVQLGARCPKCIILPSRVLEISAGHIPDIMLIIKAHFQPWR